MTQINNSNGIFASGGTDPVKDVLVGAVETGGTKFVCALATTSGKILKRFSFPTTQPDIVFAKLNAFFAKAEEEYACPSAIGIASFGPIIINPGSADHGTFSTTPKEGWSGVNILSAFSEFEGPIGLDTDVSGAALGEWKYGAGKGVGTLAYVTVGTGIGAGVVKDGVPLCGWSHYEMGHIQPPQDRDRDPYEGSCPYHGNCLEGLASGPAILDRWGRTLDDLKENGDAVALIARYLSYLTLTLVLTHMPQRIVFGGGVMKTPGLHAALRAETLKRLAGYVDAPFLKGDLSNYIVAPELGDNAGIMGAVVLASRALEQPSSQ